MLLFLKFLGCAVLFGYAGLFVITWPLGLVGSRLHMRIIKAPVRRMGKERVARLLEEAHRAPEGTEDPQLAELKSKIREAAGRSERPAAIYFTAVRVAPWVIGAAFSAWIFYA